VNKLIFLFVISIQLNAQTLLIENAPRALMIFENHLRDPSLYSKELEETFKDFNIKLDMAYASATADQLPFINHLIESELIKWFLQKNKYSYKKRASLIPDQGTPSFQLNTLGSFLEKSIAKDIDSIKNNYPGKKISFDQLSKVDQTKVNLLTPLVDLLKDKSNFNLFVKENINLIFRRLNQRLKLFALVTPRLKKSRNISYFSYVNEKDKNLLKATISEPDIIMRNSDKIVPTNQKAPVVSPLPGPSKPWQDENIYRGKKSDTLDSRGLPLPVDDWILEL